MPTVDNTKDAERTNKSYIWQVWTSCQMEGYFVLKT